MGFTDGSLHQTMSFIIGLSNLAVPKPWFTVLEFTVYLVLTS